jgi:hypothetical protein
LVTLWVAVVSQRALRFNSEIKGFPEILASMEPGQRVLSLIFDRHDPAAIAPVFLHFPAWYSAQKQGVVDVNFALFNVEPVTYRRENPPAVKLGFEWNPEKFDWRANHGELYRYFLVRTPPDLHYEDIKEFLFKGATCPISLRYRENGWWLYEATCGK